MPRVGDRDHPRRQVGDAGEHGGEVPVLGDVDLPGVHVEHHVGRVPLEEVREEGEPEPGHERRGTDAAARRRQKGHARVVDRGDAVPVATDVDAAGPGDVPEGGVQPGDRWAGARQQRTLQGLGDAPLLGVEAVDACTQPGWWQRPAPPSRGGG